MAPCQGNSSEERPDVPTLPPPSPMAAGTADPGSVHLISLLRLL